MSFGLYTLIEAGILLINAIAILNEQRFLSKSKLFFFQPIHLALFNLFN